jgi:hypothetical protein
MAIQVPRRLTILLLCALIAAIAVAGALALRASASTNARARVVLLSGQTIASGQSISSPDGHYALTMMADGNLVLELSNPYGSPRVIWSTGTGSFAGATAGLESNGNFIVRGGGGETIWSANVTSPGCANLDLQDDGNLVLYNSTGAYWATHTLQETLQPSDELLPGQTILAPGGDYELEMGTDGYLRIIDSAGTVWKSPEGGPAGSYGILYSDGDFEIRSTGGIREWYTQTYTSADDNSVLELTSTGEAELVAPSGTVTWNSDSSATRSGLTSLNIPRSYTGCATTTTTTTPTPPPPPPTPIHAHAPTSGAVTFTLPGVRVSISVRWRFNGAVSWMSDATVRRFPRRAHLTISCAGTHGCPTRTIHRHGRQIRRRERFSASGPHVRAMMRRVVGRRFRVGARVIFSVTEPGHRPERSEAIIRRGASPRSRVLH